MDARVQAKRWGTAVFLVVLLVAAVGAGGQWGLLCLVVAAVILAQWEILGLLGGRSDGPRTILCCILASFMPPASLWGGAQGLLASMACAVMVLMGAETLFRRDPSGVEIELGRRLFGIIYGGGLPCFFLLLWRLHGGVHWIVWMILITAVGDTLAYYAGTLWGKTKLLPKVSPGKTVEGAVAGLGGNVLVTLVYGYLVFPEVWGLKGFLMALVVGVAGQVGDLSESMLKRAAGVKDSGALLPGHGGVLDRLDSLLFAAPITFFWANLSSG